MRAARFHLAGWLNVDVTRVRPAAIPAMVWRAVAGGIRTVSFDPGPVQGAGLDGPDGGAREWVAAAIAIARQLSANARLIGELRPRSVAAVHFAATRSARRSAFRNVPSLGAHRDQHGPVSS